MLYPAFGAYRLHESVLTIEKLTECRLDKYAHSVLSLVSAFEAYSEWHVCKNIYARTYLAMSPRFIHMCMHCIHTYTLVTSLHTVLK